MSRSQPNDPESKVREIRRKTRRKYSAEEKIRIVLEGLKGEESIAEPAHKDVLRKQKGPPFGDPDIWLPIPDLK